VTDEQNVVDLTTVTEDDLTKLRKRNEQKLIALGQQGATVPDGLVIMTRIDTLLDLFLQPDQRVQFEFAFETQMEEILNKFLSQVRQAVLTQGVNSASKLTIPGQGRR
jgi:hypothetical protein